MNGVISDPYGAVESGVVTGDDDVREVVFMLLDREDDVACSLAEDDDDDVTGESAMLRIREDDFGYEKTKMNIWGPKAPVHSYATPGTGNIIMRRMIPSANERMVNGVTRFANVA